MAKVALNMDVFRSDGDVVVLCFLEDGGANVVDGLAIHGCKPRRTLDGILELHVIDQNGDDLDAEVAREHCEGGKDDELEADGARLRMEDSCRSVVGARTSASWLESG